MELVTLKTFDNLVEAHLIKSKLESEDLPCFLFDENIMALNPLYNFTVDGIKLKVNKFDFEKAHEILSEIDSTPITTSDDHVLICPKCQSQNLHNRFKSMKGFKGIISAIVALVLIVFPIYYELLYQCKDCGHSFKQALKKS